MSALTAGLQAGEAALDTAAAGADTMLEAITTTAAAPGQAPPVGALGAEFMFLAFLLVMLLVPWLLSRRADEAGAAAGGRSGPDESGREGASPADGGGGAGVRPGLFTSARERRLWMWAAAVVAAIWLTLSPAVEVARALRARGLLGPTTWVVIAAVVVAAGVPWLRRGPGRREIGAALGVALVYATTLVRLPVPEARSHLFEYGVLAMLVYHALLERRGNGRPVRWAAPSAVVVVTLVGWLDEVLQFFLPNRTYDLVDVGFNAIAATMGVGATALMGWARRWDVRLGRRRGGRAQ